MSVKTYDANFLAKQEKYPFKPGCLWRSCGLQGRGHQEVGEAAGVPPLVFQYGSGLKHLDNYRPQNLFKYCTIYPLRMFGKGAILRKASNQAYTVIYLLTEVLLN